MLTGLPRRYTRSEGKGEREVSPFGFYRQSSADRGPHRTFRSVVSTLSLSRARSLPTRESTTRQKQKKLVVFSFFKIKITVAVQTQTDYRVRFKSAAH